MDPRSNSYISQQYSSRYVPNLSLQCSGSSQPHRPQFFPSSNHDFNISPSRDRNFNPQVHLRPPAQAVLPPQIREATYSSNGQIFYPNSRHLPSRLPNFPSNIDCFNYAQRRGEYPFRLQEYDGERHSNSHESGRSNPAWPPKVLDDHRIRFGSRDDNRMKSHRSSGSGRVSHRNENVDIGFSSSSMIKGDYKSEGKRGNIEGSDWVPVKPQTSSKEHQRKSAFQRIQKSVYERLEEKPFGFTNSPRREDCGTLVPIGYDKLPPNVHSSQPFYSHWSFKPKSSFGDHPGYSKRSSPSKLRPRNTKKRIYREYEKPHAGKARKHDSSETSVETVRTFSRSDMTPRSKGKSLHEYASEDCGSHALATLFEATKEGGLTADAPKSSSFDVKLAQELTECNSTFVGSLSSSPSLSGRIKRVKPSPDSPDSYAKRSRNNSELLRLEETSRRLFLEGKIHCEGNVSVNQDAKSTINNTILCSSPFDVNVAADLMKDEKAVDSFLLDKDTDGKLTKNIVGFEFSPTDETRGVINSNEKAVDSTFPGKDGEDKLSKDCGEMELCYNDEMHGVLKSKYDSGSSNSNKKEYSEKSNEVEKVTYCVYECENPQKSVDEVIFYHRELRSPEIDRSNSTPEGGCTVETELNISNIANKRELPRSSPQTPLNETVYSTEKLRSSPINESDEKRVQFEDSSKVFCQDLNLKIEKAVKMIFESELFQDSSNDETQRTVLYASNQCRVDKIADSPSKRSSCEVLRSSANDEVIWNMDREPSVDNILDSDFQKGSPEGVQNSLIDETQRTIIIVNRQSSDDKIADHGSGESSSEDLQSIVNDETQIISDKNHQSPAEKIAGFASQVCSSDVFQNSGNDELQRDVDSAQKSSFEVLPNGECDVTQRTVDRVADSVPRKSSSSLEDNIPSNSSGSPSSSDSIPRSNSLRLQETRRSPNSSFTEDPQKTTKPPFKKPPSSKYPAKPRTWHRNSDSNAPPPTNVASSSYIRKGNSLIRKPTATSTESFISIGSEDPQEDSPENTTSNPKNITYVKRKANQLIASVSEPDHEIIPIIAHKKHKKPRKLNRKASRKQSKGTPITKQLVPWKWPSYRRKTLSLSHPADEDPAHPKSKHEFSFRKVKTLAGEHKYIRIGNGNKLVRETNKRTRILANEKIRWSLHTVRSRMSKKRKYCQFYTRFGNCNRTDGKCPYLHDPSKIAVCTKFLSGLCTDSRCILTHKVMPERMPDCSYFLQNLCNNGSCPYRHVHVDPSAGNCQAFLRGFCPDGDECLMKHSYECPKYAETGSCEIGLKCKLHHPTVRSKGWRSQRLGLGAGQTRYFGVTRIGSESARVEKDERLPDFISIDDSDDNCGDLGDDVEDDSIFPVRIMNVG